MRTLYISYFGALKHLCQTQVIPYLKTLAAEGMDVTLLSFEERFADPAEERRETERLRAELTAAGIDWYPMRYHKRPSLPATMYDVLQGTVLASWLVLRKRIDVLHARNAVSAAIALPVLQLFRPLRPLKLLYDMRGVMAEEYVDAGVWKHGGLPYRITKWVEKLSFQRADAIVMLTETIRRELKANDAVLREAPTPIEIIPCCVDLDRYRQLDGSAVRRRHGLLGKTVMVYAGNLGGWYMADEMALLFSVGREVIPDLHFLILTQGPPALITDALARHGIAPEHFTVTKVPTAAVPEHLAAADFGISLIKPCYSKKSSSPTKIGEYLAAGLPLISNTGIGDVDEMVRSERVGVLVDQFDRVAFRAALERMAVLLREGEAARQRCRDTAARRFSLATTGRSGYLRVYEHLGFANPDSRVAARDPMAPATWQSVPGEPHVR